jgi:hypothetical protein
MFCAAYRFLWERIHNQLGPKEGGRYTLLLLALFGDGRGRDEGNERLNLVKERRMKKL